MNDNRLSKQAFYGQLERGTRCGGGQRKRYKVTLKHNLKACSIDLKELACDISMGQIIVACDVQSFGVTLRDRTSHRAKAGGRPTACVTAYTETYRHTHTDVTENNTCLTEHS